MPIGTIVYFNGKSGWVKQEGVENLPTSLANDKFFELSDIVENSPAVVIARGGKLNFTTNNNTHQFHKVKDANTT